MPTHKFDPPASPPKQPLRDLYDPSMDQTVDRILQRRTQRELKRYKEAQRIVKEAKDPHEDLLAPTPRDKSNQIVRPVDTKLRPLDELFNEAELALDWDQEEIQSLRDQVNKHKVSELSELSEVSELSIPSIPSVPSVPSVPSRTTARNTARSIASVKTSSSSVVSTPSTASKTSSVTLVRTHTGTTIEDTRTSEKRRRWQSISKSMGQDHGWYGRNYRECRWVWRVVKKRQAKLDARKARDDQQHLKIRVSETMKDAKDAHVAIFTTGGGDTERPWKEAQLHQLEELGLEYPGKMFGGDKRSRWKRIQAEMGLPDRSYKSCQRASRAIIRLQKKSQECLDLFDQTRRAYEQAKTTYAINTSYLQNCDIKLNSASKLISFQRQLDSQLRNVARIVDGTERDYVGRPKEVRLLLERGADPNTCDRGGFSCLMAAAKYNAVETVEILLKYNADIKAVDSDKKSAILHAIEGGAAQAVQCLVRNGAIITPEEAGSIHAPSVWSKQIGKQLQLFVQHEQHSTATTIANQKWFRKFEAQHTRAQHTRAQHHEQGSRADNQIKKVHIWPPKISAGGVCSRGSTARSDYSRGCGRPPRSGESHGSRGSSGSGSSQGGHHPRGLPSLEAPSALEALRLGLEGSRQAKTRVKREKIEQIRQQTIADVEAQRPPTHERAMKSHRRRAVNAVIDGTFERDRQTNEMVMRRSMTLHRASTAVR